MRESERERELEKAEREIKNEGRLVSIHQQQNGAGLH